MVSSTSGCGVERHPDFLPDIMELLAYGICWGSQMFFSAMMKAYFLIVCCTCSLKQTSRHTLESHGIRMFTESHGARVLFLNIHCIYIYIYIM